MAGSRNVALPASRRLRMLHLGRLAGGVALGAVSEGLRSLASGRLPDASGTLFSTANAGRLAARLADMRGAAMKLGQLLSMEAGDFLPREFTDALARLRDQASPMPMLQVAGQLEAAWGADWLSHFERFHFQPVASASIGQVHRALASDGRQLAVKIQYPGVSDSIDSDVDNIAGLLKLSRLLPETDLLDDVLQEARRQLHAEADYLAEAACMRAFADRVGELPGLHVPAVDTTLSRNSVLVMEYLDGEPIDTLARQPARQRDAVASRLVQLFLKEVFEWGLVQTDPNFSNYLYTPQSDTLGLLDFGATRSYPPQQVLRFRQLLTAAVQGGRARVEQAARGVGYFGPDDPAVYRETVTALLESVAQPARARGDYDFGNSTLARRMSEDLVQLRLSGRVWRMPPPEVLFLHRKLSGLYLLCARLSARVDVATLVEPYLEDGFPGAAADADDREPPIASRTQS